MLCVDPPPPTTRHAHGAARPHCIASHRIGGSPVSWARPVWDPITVPVPPLVLLLYVYSSYILVHDYTTKYQLLSVVLYPPLHRHVIDPCVVPQSTCMHHTPTHYHAYMSLHIFIFFFHRSSTRIGSDALIFVPTYAYHRSNRSIHHYY